MIANNYQLNLSYFFAKFEINLKNYEKAGKYPASS